MYKSVNFSFKPEDEQRLEQIAEVEDEGNKSRALRRLIKNRFEWLEDAGQIALILVCMTLAGTIAH